MSDIEHEASPSRKHQRPDDDPDDINGPESDGPEDGPDAVNEDVQDEIELMLDINDSVLSDSLKTASAQVVVQNTLDEYRRLWKQFVKFCTKVTKFNVDSLAKGSKIPPDLPQWIGYWIMDKCDDTDPFTNKAKELSIPRGTYATAQKMRAAMSHKFGREFGLGTTVWMENPLKLGTFIGNPSLSMTVSQYMVSLRRRKVRLGEVVTSARAMDEETMKKLYEFNLTIPKDDLDAGPLTQAYKAEHPEWWGGSAIRTQLQLLYIISFLCLLRYDEALRIQWHWIKLETHDGHKRICVQLPFRKTHQTGGISPFYLYENPEKPWLCPVLAMARWMSYVPAKNRYGFVFRKKVSPTRFSELTDQAMSSDSFMECLRGNLLDIGIDPRPYGTHSFRRGGCQYLAMVLRWAIRDICTWAGWADNFDNPGTIFKYLLSWTDVPTVEREDYFNPKRRRGNPCGECGRTCWCA